MSRLLAKGLDRLVAWRGKRNYFQYLAQYREMETWSYDQVKRWQFGRLSQLARHAYDTVDYWKQVFDDVGIPPEGLNSFDDLARLPLLTKKTINEKGDDLLSRKPTDSRMRRRSTGGSTGQNVYFALDIDTHDRRRAAGRLTELWDDVDLGTRTATIWGASLEQKPSFKSRMFDRMTGRLFLSAYGVDDATLAGHIRQLERFRPEVISSYPSILLHIARRIGQERCRALGVRLIYTSAEALFEPVREQLQTLFDAPVRNRYASREFGMIASDCPTGDGLLLMDMRLLIEIMPTPNGEPGELVITDLDNYTMPMIRYPIGDVGIPAEGRSACGRPWSKLKSIEGRSLDVVTTPDGKAFGGTFFTLQLRPFDRSIEEYQVIQDRRDHLQIKVVTGPGFQDARPAVLARLQSALGETMSIDLVEVDSIDRLASGKRRFVVSLIDADGQEKIEHG